LIYRQIFPNGPKVSVIGLGTHQFSGEWGKLFSSREVGNIISKANDSGVNFIDTAPNYGIHLSESLIGESLIRNRHDWFLATKFGISQSAEGKDQYDYSINSISKQLNESLKALKTDYIDLYQFHSGPNDDYFNDDLWEFLSKQVEKGKIRFLGNSIPDYLVQTNNTKQIESSKDYGINTIQVVYNRLSTEAEKNIFPICKKYNLGIIARVPLAKGILSGKYEIGHIFNKDDHRNKFDDKLNQRLIIKAQEMKSRKLGEKINMSQWAISWCLKNKLISCVIPGCKNISQLETNVKSWELL
jgi:aryl-alcohol dehydrogenase-like predicted oxidoreductase